MKLIDSYGRKINYLRLAVTDRCNLRCRYCMPAEGVPKLAHHDILSYEELFLLARTAVSMGIEKVRVTGGEPLVRKGIVEFLARLSSISGLKHLVLTTNGLLLEEMAEDLRRAGVQRLNISLDSLHPETFKRVTRCGDLARVMAGIAAAERVGIPVKINMVVMRGINDAEILDFARLTLHEPYHFRFIEYMPIGVANKENLLRHVPDSLIKKQLSSLGTLVQVSKNTLDGPAERFKFQGAPGEIGFISALSNHFCATCNRLRLTPTGNLRACLLFDHEIDLKGPMRMGASDKELERIFLKAAFTKPHSHYLASENSILPSGHMSAIGG